MAYAKVFSDPAPVYAEVPECKKCKAWEKLCEAKDELLVAYRTGRAPKESTWKKLKSAKKELGIAD